MSSLGSDEMVTELFEAIKKGDREAVVRLLAAEPTLAAADEKGVPAVLVALYWRKEDVARLLARQRGDLSIFEAAALGDATRIRALLDGDPSLASGHDRISRLLVEAGADVNAAHGRGFRPLHAAAEHRAHEMVALLLERGADPTARNGEGMSAADFARSRGDEALARLIEAAVKH